MKLIIKIFLIALIVNSAYSQGGSNYSVFGLGDFNYSSEAAYQGIGNTSIAMPFDHSINLENPALWSTLQLTTLNAGYRFNQHLNKDAGGNVLYQSNGQVNGVKLLFVVDTSRKIAVSLGFYPYTQINYLIMSPISTTLENLEVKGQTVYGGSGGLSQGYIGASVEVIEGIKVGANAFGIFGIAERIVETSFPDEIYSFTSLTKRRNSHEGYGFRAGVYIDAIKNFGLGVFYSYQPQVDVRSDLIYTMLSGADTSFRENYNFKVPDIFGFGASYRSGKFLFGADFSMQNFEGFTYNTGPQAEFGLAYQSSVGVARVANTSPNAEFFDKGTYTLGFEYNKLYYNVRGVDISELAASLGAQLAVTDQAHIDAAISLGMRGTTDNELVQEYFGRLSVNISIGEMWFNPFRRDFE